MLGLGGGVAGESFLGGSTNMCHVVFLECWASWCLFFFKLSTEKIRNQRFGADFVRETHEDTPLARPTATVMPMPLAGVVLPVEVEGMGKAGTGSCCLPSLQSWWFDVETILLLCWFSTRKALLFLVGPVVFGMTPIFEEWPFRCGARVPRAGAIWRPFWLY